MYIAYYLSKRSKFLGSLTITASKGMAIHGAGAPAFRFAQVIRCLAFCTLCFLGATAAFAAHTGAASVSMLPLQAQQANAMDLLDESICPQGLVHHFGLDEKTGGAYLDYAGGADATCTDCPSPAAGLFDGAQRFNGTGNGIKLNEIQNFEWGPNSSFTIELWVQVTGTSAENRVIIGRKANDSDMHWWLGIRPDGYAEFAMYDRLNFGFSTVDDTKKINDGEWHHLAVVRDGIHRRNKLYVDGYRVKDFEYNATGNFESPAAPLTIGYLNSGGGYRFSGVLDEIMVYNRDLSENEMRQRYNSGAGNYCGPQQVLPVIRSTPVTHGVTGQPYLYDVQATGHPAPVYALVAAPTGMTVNAATGEIIWTPAAAGTSEVTVKAENSVGSAEQRFQVKVKEGVGEAAGLVHHWMLHEVVGTSYKDFYTPYDAVCSPDARPAPIAGVVSGGQRFNGKSTGLNVSNSSNFNWKPEDSFTIEFWMRSEAKKGGNMVIVGRDAADSEMHWWIGVDGSGFAGFNLMDINYQGAFVGHSGPELTDNRWHQVVAVRENAAGMNKLYVDGVKIGEERFIYKNSFASLAAVNMGYLNLPEEYRYEGDLDEVKLFQRALSDAEIMERYQTVFDGIVELVKFTGKYSNQAILLHWETQVEIDLANFVVERSEDGENFTDFEEIGTVPAAGNSAVSLSYDLADQNPLKGVSYYRLRVVKESGAFYYSNIIKIDFGGLNASAFYVYPNPASRGSDIKVEVDNLNPGESATFFISDLSGKKLLTQEVEADAAGLLQLDVTVSEKLRNGIYSLTVVTPVKTISRKLVVLQ